MKNELNTKQRIVDLMQRGMNLNLNPLVFALLSVFLASSALGTSLLVTTSGKEIQGKFVQERFTVLSDGATILLPRFSLFRHRARTDISKWPILVR